MRVDLRLTLRGCTCTAGRTLAHPYFIAEIYPPGSILHPLRSSPPSGLEGRGGPGLEAAPLPATEPRATGPIIWSWGLKRKIHQSVFQLFLATCHTKWSITHLWLDVIQLGLHHGGFWTGYSERSPHDDLCPLQTPWKVDSPPVQHLLAKWSPGSASHNQIKPPFITRPLLRHTSSSPIPPPPPLQRSWTTCEQSVNGIWTDLSFFCCSLAETLENFSGHVLLIPLPSPPSPSLFLILHYCLPAWSRLFLCTYIHIRGMFWFWTYPAQIAGF